MEITKENKRKLISAGITVLVHLIVLLLLLVIGLPYQDPPPPEIGVEMSADELTEAEDGYAGMIGGGETTEEPNLSTANNEEPSVTQNTEDVPLTAKPNKKSPKTQPVTEEKPKVDENAMFKPGQKKKGGSGQGTGGGDGTGQGQGSGQGVSGDGAGTSGTSFSLSGRGAKSLSTPKTNRTETGNVVVEIKVDQQGNVIEARAGAKGTTLMNTNIWRTCEQAAKKSKFSAKEDAPEIQKGTITYKFVR